MEIIFVIFLCIFILFSILGITITISLLTGIIKIYTLSNDRKIVEIKDK